MRWRWSLEVKAILMLILTDIFQSVFWNMIFENLILHIISEKYSILLNIKWEINTKNVCIDFCVSVNIHYYIEILYISAIGKKWYLYLLFLFPSGNWHWWASLISHKLGPTAGYYKFTVSWYTGNTRTEHPFPELDSKSY